MRKCFLSLHPESPLSSIGVAAPNFTWRNDAAELTSLEASWDGMVKKWRASWNDLFPRLWVLFMKGQGFVTEHMLKVLLGSNVVCLGGTLKQTYLNPGELPLTCVDNPELNETSLNSVKASSRFLWLCVRTHQIFNQDKSLWSLHRGCCLRSAPWIPL